MMKRALAVFAVVANLVLVDAIAKELAAGCLKNHAAVSILPNLFDLAYVENRGCAWGLFQGQVWPLAVFGLFALAIIIWRHRTIFGTGRGAFLAEVLLEAGIIGNLIDRICRGYVIDFFDFHWWTHHFPCFNLADAYITTAAGLLILFSLNINKKKQ